jgi:hypothetical protein
MPPVAPRLPLGKGKVKGKGKQPKGEGGRTRGARLLERLRWEAIERLRQSAWEDAKAIEREIEAKARARARAEYLRSMNPWRWILMGDI